MQKKHEHYETRNRDINWERFLGYVLLKVIAFLEEQVVLEYWGIMFKAGGPFTSNFELILSWLPTSNCFQQRIFNGPFRLRN